MPALCFHEPYTQVIFPACMAIHLDIVFHSNFASSVSHTIRSPPVFEPVTSECDSSPAFYIPSCPQQTIWRILLHQIFCWLALVKGLIVSLGAVWMGGMAGCMSDTGCLCHAQVGSMPYAVSISYLCPMPSKKKDVTCRITCQAGTPFSCLICMHMPLLVYPYENTT